MKSLPQYIIENAYNICSFINEDYEETKDIRNKIRNDLRKKWFNRNNEEISQTKSTAPLEIFRKGLGENSDEAYQKLLEIFKDIENVEVTDECEVVGRAVGGSGTYSSFKIKYNDGETEKTFYVANTTNSKAYLKNKELTPDKLGLSNMTYNSFESLYNELLSKIEIIKSKYPNSNIYELLTGIIEIINNEIPNKSGSFLETSIEKFFSSSAEGSILYESNETNNLKNLIDNVREGDIHCIEKDFGEIIGPLVFLKIFSDSEDIVEVSYPKTSNEQLIDYYINGHKISAKQLGGGGAPSGSAIANAIKNEAIVLNNPKELENKIENLPNKDKKIIFSDPLEQEFIKDVMSTYDESIFNQQKILINNFVLNSSKYADLKDHIGFSEEFAKFENYNDLVKKLDETLNIKLSKNNETISDYFDKLYRLANYNLTPKSEWNPKSVEEKYNSIEPKIKWGIFFYPLYKTAINEIIDKYGGKDDKDDIISSVVQKMINMKQIYFGIRKKSGIKLEIISAGASKWVFTTGGMSTNNINNAKLSLKIKY